LSQHFFNCGIYFCKFDLTLQLRCGLLVFWFKSFAMSAPRGIELNHPDIFGGHDHAVEIGRVKLNNIIA